MLYPLSYGGWESVSVARGLPRSAVAVPGHVLYVQELAASVSGT